MASVRHDVLLLALKENPLLLADLLQRVQGARLSGPFAPGDATLRFAGALEVRPDLLFTGPAPGSPWLLVEVQNRPDETKARTWHLATSVLVQKHGMGDLLVITASRAVARWAPRVAQLRGPLGTEKGVKPVVLHLSRREVEPLLDPATPQLALFAVWARCRGAGPEARRVLERALELTATLPPPLRDAQRRAILSMLGERLLQELAMDPNKIPETKLSRKVRLMFEARHEEGMAAARRASLLSVLTARGLTPSPEEQAWIDALHDDDLFDRCIRAAVTATTVAQALAPLSRRPRRAASPRRPSRTDSHQG